MKPQDITVRHVGLRVEVLNEEDGYCEDGLVLPGRPVGWDDVLWGPYEFDTHYSENACGERYGFQHNDQITLL